MSPTPSEIPQQTPTTGSLDAPGEFIICGIPISPARLYPYLWIPIFALFLLRCWHLGADYTTDYSYSRDGVLYSDEGWYSANAVSLVRTGHWYRPGDLNFAVNLPVLQVLHAVSFTAFGVGIVPARLTIVFCLGVSLLLLYLLVLKLEDRWTAMLAVAWIVWNYFMFLHSRFALGEIPASMFVLGAFYLATFVVGSRGCWAAAGGAVCLMLAFYTKTNAIFAFPLYFLALAWFLRPSLKAILAQWGVALGVCGGLFLLHYLLLARPYWEDYRYFYTLNLQANAKFDLLGTLGFGFDLFDKLSLVDKIFHRVLVYTVPLFLIFLPGYRRDPLVWFSLLWIGIYLAMLSIYSILRPRYWPLMVAPMAILLAVGLQHLWMVKDKSRWIMIPIVAYGLALAGSFARQSSLWIDYYRNVEYSFTDMAAEIKRTLDADPDSRNLLLGHFADTVALYEDIVPINDRFAPTSLESRLEKSDPRYLLTESEHQLRDYANQWATIPSDQGGLRDAALKKHYAQIEMIRQFDVFDNYKDWPLSFYRLRPLKE